MIGSLGWQELLIILVILALLFGASRVAGLGGALGRGIREFRTEARGDDDKDKDATASTAAKTEDDSTPGTS
jgi:sec-independent protein translocase protein TatA